MKFFQKRSFFSFMIALGVGANLFCGAVLTARAEVIDYQALAEANLSIPVESNEIKNWPEGPILNARSAILMDADSNPLCQKYPRKALSRQHNQDSDCLYRASEQRIK